MVRQSRVLGRFNERLWRNARLCCSTHELGLEYFVAEVRAGSVDISQREQGQTRECVGLAACQGVGRTFVLFENHGYRGSGCRVGRESKH